MAISKVIYKTSAQDTGTVWMDATPATAAAADITAPKTAMLANGVLTTGTGSGGGSVTVEEKDVNFIDYDGTIVASYTAAEFADLSALPANPSHTGLTAQGWNWSLSDAKTYVASYGKLWIGQMYTTSDGKTRIYIHLDNPDFLSPYLSIAVNGTVSVDWGDGSSADTMTGTSLTTLKYQGHAYSATGDYVIAIAVSSGNFAFYGASNYASVLRAINAANNRSRSQAYSNAITKVEIGSSAVLGNYCFYKVSMCKSITIPNTIQGIGDYAFYHCYSLKFLTIPNAITSIGPSAFRYCYNLQSVAIPKGVTSIGTYAFDSCQSLKIFMVTSDVTSIATYAFNACSSLQYVIIPNSVESIGNYAFYYCYSLQYIMLSTGVKTIGVSAFDGCASIKSITIPGSITSIGNSAFSYCYGIYDYHFLPTTVPTFGTSVFNAIQSGTVIYVPVGKLSDYKSATNVSTYASYMQEEPA